MTPLLNNRYRILKILGRGGCGQTFLAEDTHMPSKRRCVVKQLKPATSDPVAQQIIEERFQREAVILEALGESSDQIPTLYAYFTEAREFYLVQALIEGMSLTQKVREEGKFNESSARDLLINLLPTLDYIHSKGIIHRDIKPDNIMLRERDQKPVLIDFGAVKEVVSTVIDSYGAPTSSIVIGSPGFMPLEQAAGKPIFASDQYSLGLTVIYCLTGKFPQELTDPFTGGISWHELVPDLSSHLKGVLDKAIQLFARDRFTTAREMMEAIHPPSITIVQSTTVSLNTPLSSDPTPKHLRGTNTQTPDGQAGDDISSVENPSALGTEDSDYQVLAEFVKHGSLFAVGDDDVFLVTETERGEQISRVNKVTGGDLIPVANPDSRVRELVESSGYLYWMTLKRRIQRISIDGGQVETVANFAGRWGPICVDAERIYWLEKADSETGVSSPGGLMTAPLMGGEIRNLLQEYKREASNGQLIVDQSNLYWVGDDNYASVYKIPKTGGVSSLISKHSGDTDLRLNCEYDRPLAQDEEYIYAANSVSIKRARKIGGPPTTIVRYHRVDPDLSVYRLAVDSQYLYFAGTKKVSDKDVVGVIAMVQKSGGDARIIMTTSEMRNVERLIPHNGYIYFAGPKKVMSGDGLICRLQVPGVKST
jgi:serine/threonine protein kinase